MKLFHREVGSGIPLIIIHGLYGSSDNWLSIARSFPEGYRIILPDLRNHGKSGHSHNVSYGTMAADVWQLIDSLGIDFFFLAGHSMGGKVAMQMTFQQMERVKKLLIIDISPRDYYTLTTHESMIKAMLELPIEEIRTISEADNLLKPYIQEQRIRMFLLKNIKSEGKGKFSWKLNLQALYDNLPLIAQGIRSSEPFEKETLFMKGSLSHYITEKDKPFIETLFPIAAIQIFEGASHWLHAEKTEEFVKSATEFFGVD